MLDACLERIHELERRHRCQSFLTITSQLELGWSGCEEILLLLRVLEYEQQAPPAVPSGHLRTTCTSHYDLQILTEPPSLQQWTEEEPSVEVPLQVRRLKFLRDL